MKPPEWFVSMLRLNHPLVSVRWGEWVGKWVISQRAYIHPSEIHYLEKRRVRLEHWIAYPKGGEPTTKHKNALKNVNEELIAARAKERILFMPDAINQAAYDMLCHGEHARYGGYARFCDAQEQEADRIAEDQERQEENKRFALHSESYDQIDFMTRRRQDALKNGHRDLGYLLHGEHANKPLVTLGEF